MTKPNLKDFESIEAYQDAVIQYNKAHNKAFVAKMPKPSKELIAKHNALRKSKPKKEAGLLGSIIQEKRKGWKE